ncbi:zinc finger BED domain-containing protein RICESLEEPER 2-like [Setaria viridis]|uniref:zinc finger BED domain-containing protein RICESLEEPER 2-like n=1 Tax=Setaria viridis TaxID=4556 RepID=UPI001493D295|nr:zinc finger BED domain-containing protein RICESLEEPER 2-like [Setaria viridis]
MGNPNSNDSSMVHDNHMIHGTDTMFEDCEMMLGSNDMVDGCQMIIGDKMDHGGQMILDYKVVDIHDNKMAPDSEVFPGSKMDCGYEIIHYDQTVFHCSEMAQDSEMANGNETVEVTPQTSSRRRRKKSMVWEHFTTEESEGCTKACCNHCKGFFAYSSGSKMAGTSHLKRHITMGHCPVIKGHEPSAGGRDNGGQGTLEKPSKRRRTCAGYANAPFNPDLSSSYLAKMIILHDYPLHIVQQPTFISFIEGLQPRFKVVNTDVMEAEVYAIYLKERDNLLKEVGNIPGRINLTIGWWTTSQTLGYVSIAGQYIDSDWKLHRRMLNFVMAPWSCSGNAVSEAISRSLSQWNMTDKLFTITGDYESSHDIYSVNLRDDLSKKSIPMLRGQFLVVRCYAHILNAAASDVTASVQSVIYKIRESIKFIKSCTSHEQQFTDIIQQLQIPSNKTLCLDIKAQWNTTHLMLLAALDYKQAFTMLEKFNDNYNQAPSAVDWEEVEVACSYLKLLYDSAHSIMATEDPTANIFFHEAWTIQREISSGTDLQDPISSRIAKDVHERFDKYWKDCNVMLAIAVVMDPRFKMKIVEFSYSKIYGPKGVKYVKVVDDAVHELYKEYVRQPLPLVAAHVEHGANGTLPTDEKKILTIPPSTGDALSDFDIYLSEAALSKIPKSELDQYLEEAPLPRIPEFDILKWWKLNALKYPTLSRMARDVLAIPVSTVGRGSVFSSARSEARMLDDYLSSLHPETLEALFCAKDWLQNSPPAPKPPSTTSAKK